MTMTNRDGTAALLNLINPTSAQMPREKATGADGTIDPGVFLQHALPIRQRFSYGEQQIIEFALTVWNGSDTARLAGLTHMDRPLRARVLAILTEVWG